MGAVNVGSASVTIMPTMNGFAGKLNKQLGSAGTSGGAAFSKAFGGKAGGASGGIVSKFKSAGTSAGAQMGAAAGAALSAKGAAIAGIAGGIASAAAQKITAALSSLSGEMASASDSAQKFAGTLGFGGVDTSTIDALTASTQEYADNTVYDLDDIRNTTAQLAANGVDDYAQLAEAAGNLNAVAGGNAETFKSVGMVMTQTAGAGKLTTENWNQLADAIPGASGKLQEAMKANGAYTGNFRDAMEKGEISAEEFNQAIMQLGMTDVAKEAATSTATFEGAMGNLEASAVTAGAKVLDAFKPLLTGGMASAGEAIDGIGDSVADFLSKCQDNGAIQALSDDVSLLGGAALDVMGAVGSLVGAVLGIEPGADGAADAADSFKGALDAAHPAIQGVADAASWLRDNAAKAAPAVRALAAGFVLMKAASAVAGAVKSLSGTLTAVSTLSTFAAGGLTAMAGGETAAGTAASLSAGQVLALGAAVLMVGAGVALAAAGILLLATAAMQVASAGPGAALAMLGMVAAVAALALGAAALGPALTAGAVGMLAFGAAALMVGAGIALATGGIAALAPMLPLVSAYGASAAVGVAALGAGMFVLVRLGLRDLDGVFGRIGDRAGAKRHRPDQDGVAIHGDGRQVRLLRLREFGEVVFGRGVRGDRGGLRAHGVDRLVDAPRPAKDAGRRAAAFQARRQIRRRVRLGAVGRRRLVREGRRLQFRLGHRRRRGGARGRRAAAPLRTPRNRRGHRRRRRRLRGRGVARAQPPSDHLGLHSGDGREGIRPQGQEGGCVCIGSPTYPARAASRCPSTAARRSPAPPRGYAAGSGITRSATCRFLARRARRANARSPWRS